ncbi:MAG: hypothetical protein AAGA77_08040 [Bacteroidota bacterium]
MRLASNSKLLNLILGLLFLGITSTVIGQANIKVGYNLGYANLGATKSVFDRFNALNPQAEQSLSPARFYHGIELGLRYKFDNLGIDVGVSSSSGSSEAINVLQADGSLGNDDWRISLFNYSIGLENYFGTFGVGATIGNQTLKYGTNFSASSGRRTIFEESVLNSKFYFIIEVPSKAVAFSLRPFITTTWSPYNIQDVELQLDPQSTIAPSELDENIMMFGISFLFYNGPQRR